MTMPTHAWRLSANADWLAASYRAPSAFFAELLASHAEFSSVRPKSVVGERYDLFHDIVLRNLAGGAPALRWFGSDLRPQELSYRQLAFKASARATAWRKAGAEPGQVVCVLRPEGSDWFISVVAALKCGLVLSILPVLGRQFVTSRLASLAPDHLDVDPLYVARLGVDRAIVLPCETSVDDDAAALERSESYAAGAPAAMLFDPTCEDAQVPRAVSSDALYLASVRDGALALKLRPGDAFAAPGMPLLELQPSAALAVLARGATYVHLTVEEVERSPELLLAARLRTVGISPEVREVLLAAPARTAPTWGAWFRQLAGIESLERWSELIAVAQLGEATALNLRWHAAAGGCVLMSAGARGVVDFEVLPSPGAPWTLADLQRGDVESGVGHGRFRSLLPGADDSQLATPLVVARHRRGWAFVGTTAQGPRGRYYPTEEANLALRGVAPGCVVSACVRPAMGAEADAQVVILVFVGAAAKVDEAALVRAVRDRLVDELGPAYAPEQVACYPLVPRRDDAGEIDHSWCRDEYLSGGLARKARDEMYRALSELRGLIGSGGNTA